MKPGSGATWTQKKWRRLPDSEAAQVVLAGTFITTDDWIDSYGFRHIAEWPSDVVVKSDDFPTYWRWC